MNVAIIGCSSVEYWARWGDQFCASVEAMRTKPAEVIVASLEPLSVPSFVTNILSTELFWDSWNDAIRYSTAEWVWPTGIDDLFEVDALDGLNEAADVIAVSGMESTGQTFFPDAGGFERILTSSDNPMRGSIMLRRSVAVELPWRRTKWADWCQWCEIRAGGYLVDFDTKVRFNHTRHAEALSLHPDPVAQQHVELLKRLLLDGRVVRGPEWPPVLLG